MPVKTVCQHQRIGYIPHKSTLQKRPHLSQPPVHALSRPWTTDCAWSLLESQGATPNFLGWYLVIIGQYILRTLHYKQIINTMTSSQVMPISFIRHSEYHSITDFKPWQESLLSHESWIKISYSLKVAFELEQRKTKACSGPCHVHVQGLPFLFFGQFFLLLPLFHQTGLPFLQSFFSPQQFIANIFVGIIKEEHVLSRSKSMIGLT